MKKRNADVVKGICKAYIEHHIGLYHEPKQVVSQKEEEPERVYSRLDMLSFGQTVLMVTDKQAYFSTVSHCNSVEYLFNDWEAKRGNVRDSTLFRR